MSQPPTTTRAVARCPLHHQLPHLPIPTCKVVNRLLSRVFLCLAAEYEIGVLELLSTIKLKFLLRHDLGVKTLGSFVLATLNDRPIVVKKFADNQKVSPA